LTKFEEEEKMRRYSLVGTVSVWKEEKLLEVDNSDGWGSMLYMK
jgi:hypothetical protein